MAIIYTYPIIPGNLKDNLLVSDSTKGNKTSQVSISKVKDLIDVVDSFNSLTGDVTISGGTNITFTTSGNNIEINSSAISGTGTAGTIPKWGADGSSLVNSIIKDQGGEDIIIPRYIKHDGFTTNVFGFSGDREFIVSVGPSTADQFFVSTTGIIMKTDSGNKLVAGPVGVTLYSDTSDTQTTTSFERFATTTTGAIVYGQTIAQGAASERGGIIRFNNNANDRFVGISGPVTQGVNYQVRLPDSVGTASQVLKLNNPMLGGQTQDLVWGDAASGTGGFETLPLATANGYISGELSVGTYVFQMIAPSNCTPTNFKFYNFLGQSTGRTTTVAIYKGIIGDEGVPGSLQSTGQIAGELSAAQISGSTFTLEDSATAISAGDNIVICFSIDEEIQPLGVIPITASGGIALTNASPVSNVKLAIHDPNVSFTAAQIKATATTVTALEALLTGKESSTSRPFLLIY